MQFFECSRCRQLVYFENSTCLNCGSQLGYAPADVRMFAVEPTDTEEWNALGATSAQYRLCRNGVVHQVCNWLVPAEEKQPFCRACRLNEIIPDLGVSGNLVAWARLEQAKRRMLYGLLSLGLPVQTREEDPAHGLGYRLLADEPGANKPVLTGHVEGVITLNIAEADDAERERRKQALGEPYRTLLGHFRHEIGHYYWNLLIRNGGRLEEFRACFGDDRLDYQKALEAHYAQGAPANWQEQFISAYATMHPWEDWAETWAHYLHMRDTLETASACGVSVALPDRPRRALHLSDHVGSFEEIMQDWILLTHVLNNLNRGLGQPDSYPFVISPAVSRKLEFVHQTIQKD